MKARIHCKHCEKYYDVELEDVRLIQAVNGESITFAHNTYYYDDDCFFKTLNRIRRDIKEKQESA